MNRGEGFRAGWGEFCFWKKFKIGELKREKKSFFENLKFAGLASLNLCLIFETFKKTLTQTLQNFSFLAFEPFNSSITIFPVSIYL